tara:strand:- start:1296 stop:2303 length:1008 start_codon:yes stop_codon:yes gene_type:complete
MFNGKNIFISGGTGSFGNKFIEILVKKYKPKKIIVYSRDEYKQFLMKEKYAENKFSFLRFFIGDVRDKERLTLAMKDVDYVVHAAALKHVPAAEYDPMEFVKTNIYGAENIIQASINQKVKKIIALSTDKAANPLNLYGATKLASDKIFTAANNIVGSQNTIFSVVRYGNVLGSRGSVVPIFKDYINKGKDYLPVTDKNMTRFWITLEEGVNFVIKSFMRMSGGEIFVPKIPSIRIMDLARAMKKDIKIKVTGIRPGEKVHELMCPREYSDFTFDFKDHYVIFSQIHRSLSKKHYSKNRIGERGKKVSKNFEYSSDKNKDFLTVKKIQMLNRNLE